MAASSLLTNHGLAVVCIARLPGARLRDIAECVGVTERAAHRIVSELCEAGYVTRERVGRRNFYEVHPDVPLSNGLLSERQLGDLLSGLIEGARPARDRVA
jgi:DNA-binding transcriptional ArsR family regulator